MTEPGIGDEILAKMEGAMAEQGLDALVADLAREPRLGLGRGAALAEDRALAARRGDRPA